MACHKPAQALLAQAYGGYGLVAPQPLNYIPVYGNSAYPSMEMHTVGYKDPVSAETTGVDQSLPPVDPGFLEMIKVATYAPTAEPWQPLPPIVPSNVLYETMKPKLVAEQLEYPLPYPYELKQSAKTFSAAAKLPGNYGPSYSMVT